MKIQSVLILTVVIVVIVSLLCISLFPSVQDFMSYNTTWNGIRHSLIDLNAGTIDTLKGLPAASSKDVLITIPYMQYNDTDLEELKNFVDGGGTLMLMDDYGYGNSILEYLNIDCRFSGDALLDPLFCYKNQWFPEITDFSSAIGKNVQLVVMDHATALINTNSVEVVAWSSPESYLDKNGNEKLDKGEVPGPLPVAARLHFGGGMIILVSDPSIIINSMVVKDDNLLFVNQLIGPEAQTGHIMIDTSHLVKKPMDVTKAKLADAERVLLQPYVLLGIVFLIFMGTSIFVLKTGGAIGRKS
jgi:hypothetical protein